MKHLWIILTLTLIIASCQEETDLHLKHIDTFYIDAWARAFAIHPQTGDILSIHDHHIVTGDVLEIQQHTIEGEFVKTLVDFERIDGASYGLYFPKDMVIGDSGRIFVLVYPVIELPDEGIKNVINQQLSILSFGLDGNLLDEYYFTVDSRLNNPAKIATCGNFLYATNGEEIWELNLSDGQLEQLPLHNTWPEYTRQPEDMKCDQQGGILISYRLRTHPDSVKSEIYRYDKCTEESSLVLESHVYQHLHEGCCYRPSMFFDDTGHLYTVTSYVGSLEIFNQELEYVYSNTGPATSSLKEAAWDVAAANDYVFILGFMEVYVFHWE